MNHYALVAALSAIGLAGCATAASDNNEISERAAKRLAEFDRTGEVDSCLNLRQINQITALDDHRFLVRVGANRYYLNEVKGRCSGAARTSTRLQYTTSHSQLCRNEIISVVDNTAGFTVGSCGLGGFERLEKKPPAEE